MTDTSQSGQLHNAYNTVTKQMKSFHKESIHFFDEMKNTIIINSKS